MDPLDQHDLMSAETQQCPYEFYELARRRSPIYRMPNRPISLVIGFDAAREVVRRPDTFLSGVSPMALAEGSVPQEVIDIYVNDGWIPLASCSTSDPPVQTRVRGFLEKLFTAQAVATMKPIIDRIADQLIDEFADRGSVDLVREFAHPMPMTIIAELLGVPTTDLERFKAWSDAIVEPFSMMISREREIECARLVVEMQHYFAEMIEDRRRDPKDDMITAAVQHRDADGKPFDMQELLTIVTVDLLASGNETTTAAIASGMKLLVEDPAPIDEVRADPSLYRNLVEEVLRLESPAQGMFRRCSEDATVGDDELKEDDLLSVRFGAANRDENLYPDPDRIDLHRQRPGKHLAFGMGRHHCIGAPLARQELLTAFTALLTRFDDFHLTPGAPEPEYIPSFFGRNLRELQVSFKPRR